MMIGAEDHTNFYVQELGGVKGIATRALYEQRMLLTNLRRAVLRTDIPGELHDLLHRTEIGPEEILFSDDPYGALVSGRLADAARQEGLQFFWYGKPEHTVRRELGLNGWMTPERMLAVNNKATFRRIARRIGSSAAVPPHRMCRSVTEIRNAYRDLSLLSDGVPIPDAQIGKLPHLLAGAGMKFLHSGEDLDAFCRAHREGDEVIIETAWTDHTPGSVHWNVGSNGYARAGITVQLIENGCNHIGNIIAAGDRDLPGVGSRDISHLCRLTEPFARYWWHRGYRGPIGIDVIHVRGLCGERRWFAIEPNIFRPPAPRYIMALGHRLDHRLRGRWAIAMSDCHVADSAASSFSELVRILRGPRGRSLLFDGATGVIPLLTGLLPAKFIAVCVGRDTREAVGLLKTVERTVGGN